MKTLITALLFTTICFGQNYIHINVGSGLVPTTTDGTGFIWSVEGKHFKNNLGFGIGYQVIAIPSAPHKSLKTSFTYKISHKNDKVLLLPTIGLLGDISTKNIFYGGGVEIGFTLPYGMITTMGYGAYFNNQFSTTAKRVEMATIGIMLKI